MNKTDQYTSFVTGSVTMVIRSAGERTVDLCKKLIEEQGYKDEIFFTREAPFSAALRKSYEIGIREGKPWTFCVDADVLLRENSIESLLQFARDQEENVFEVQGLVHDKFFTIPRQAGNHFYRTSMLDEAIKLIPEEGVDIRPESYVLRTMQKNGYPYRTFSSIIGLHDFEQFYFDIYRKAFVQAYKHLNYTEEMIPLWKERQQNDKDYEVALKAFTDGILNSEEVYIDKKQDLYQEKFERLNIPEKEPVSTNNYDLYVTENMLKDRFKDEYIHLNEDREQQNIRSKLKTNIKEYGFFKSFILTGALSLVKIGNKVKNKIEKKVG